ncbi:MAG: hypothetical protein ACLTZW_01365 [Paratractidigestivibacter faecalis]
MSIVGVGCTPFKDFETHPETQGIGEGEAFGYAALEAIADAGLEPRDVDFFYHGSANPYLVGDCITPNMQVADWIGMRAKGSVHHSEACCTGSWRLSRPSWQWPPAPTTSCSPAPATWPPRFRWSTSRPTSARTSRSPS